jgi:cytochrome c553
MRKKAAQKNRTARSALTALLSACALTPCGAEPARQSDPPESCVPCHGRDGIGRDAEIPNLAGQNETYLYNQLRAFRDGRREHREMAYVSRTMSDEDMRGLAAYFAALPPR